MQKIISCFLLFDEANVKIIIKKKNDLKAKLALLRKS